MDENTKTEAVEADVWLLACRDGECRTFSEEGATWTVDRRTLEISQDGGASSIQIVGVPGRDVRASTAVVSPGVATFKALQALCPDPMDAMAYREYQETVRQFAASM